MLLFSYAINAMPSYEKESVPQASYSDIKGISGGANCGSLVTSLILDSHIMFPVTLNDGIILMDRRIA